MYFLAPFFRYLNLIILQQCFLFKLNFFFLTHTALYISVYVLILCSRWCVYVQAPLLFFSSKIFFSLIPFIFRFSSIIIINFFFLASCSRYTPGRLWELKTVLELQPNPRLLSRKITVLRGCGGRKVYVGTKLLVFISPPSARVLLSEERKYSRRL